MEEETSSSSASASRSTAVTTLGGDYEQSQGEGQEEGSSSSAGQADSEQDEGESDNAQEDAATVEVTQIAMVDEDGETVGYIPISVEGDTASIHVVSAQVPSDSWYTDTGETMTVATVSLVIILVAVLAIFGAVTIGTLLRSFEVGKDA